MTLPLLALHSPVPTEAPLPVSTISVRVAFLAPSSATLTFGTALDANDPRVKKVIDWAVRWVTAAFPVSKGLAWTLSHAQFSQAIRTLTCAKLNTAGTFKKTTPWTLQTFHQRMTDTNGSQYVEFIFAVELSKVKL